LRYKQQNRPSYETLAEACFGINGFRFIAINMFIMAYGAMLSYLMIVKDTFGTLLLGKWESTHNNIHTSDAVDMHPTTSGQDPELMRRAILLVISLCIILPLSCKRDMADLAQTSRLNVFIDATLVALVAYNAPIKEAWQAAAQAETPPNMLIHTDTIFVGLGVLSFAFVCQHSAFIIAGSLQNPTTNRWSQVTSGALSFCAFLALCCGVFGFLGYRDHTKGNILQNLDEDSVSANIARAMLGTTMMFVYPLESFVTRHVCVVLLFAGRAAHEGDDAHILSRRDRRIGLTVALYILAVVPAAFFEDLGNVLAVTGTIAGSCLSYAGPGMCYLGVHGERFLQLIKESSWWGNGKRNRTLSNDVENGTDGIVVVSEGSPNKPTLAVETTPLVSGKVNATDRAGSQNDSANDNNDEIVLTGFLPTLTWYLLGMPIWVAIAKEGKAKLKKHVHDMVLKSPHPIRIGEVEYSKVIVHMAEKDDEMNPNWKELMHMNSDRFSRPSASMTSSLRGITGSGSGVNINQAIGKELLQKQQQKQRNDKKNAMPEADPQDEPPSWLDFYIAIMFVLLGVVAVVAGLYSLYRKKA
jgi:sodium-coupled neutral amino acid transporter 11